MEQSNRRLKKTSRHPSIAPDSILSARSNGCRLRTGLLSALLAAGLAVCALTGNLCAQGQLKPEEQAAIVLAAGRKAYNEKQYPVAIDRFGEYLKTFGNQKDANSARYGL